MFKVLGGCAVSILCLISAFYIWSSTPTARGSVGLEARIERLVRYNQHLQHALAQATAAAEVAEQELVTPLDDLQQDTFAYVFYATSDPYACSVLVNIQRLSTVGSTLAIHVLVSPEVSLSYVEALRHAGATVHIQAPPELADGAGGYYKDCLLKLLAFKMHVLAPGLTRVLVLDSDQLILKSMDPLFTGLPDVDLAAPRAYWLSKDFLASTFMMITLSDRLWQSVQAALAAVEYNKFDMDLVNILLGDQVMMLPGEFVTLNSHWEEWNLPKWFHPGSELNMTTVHALNRLVKSQGFVPTIKVASYGDTQDKRQLDDELVTDVDPASSNLASTSSTLTYTSSSVGPSTSGEPTAEPDVFPLPSPSPRFPMNHPITSELYRLYEAAAILHFTALGKPWVHSTASVEFLRPDAHPLLAAQIESWREVAREVCPGGLEPQIPPSET